MFNSVKQGLGAAAALLVAASMAPAAGVPSLADGRLAWWHFDPGVQNETREISNRDEDLDGPATYVESVLGQGRAARFAPGLSSGLTHPASVSGAHWTKVPSSGVLTGCFAFTTDDGPDADGGTLLSSWNGASQSWRVRLAPVTGEIELQVVPAGKSLVTVSSGVAIADDTTYIVIWTIDEVAHTLELQVWTNGTPSRAVTAPFDGVIPSNGAAFQVGRDSSSSATAAAIRADVLAFWERTLTATERTALIDRGAGPNYVELFLSDLPAPGYLLERVTGAFDGDVRHVFMGDSFVAHNGAGRIPIAMLRAITWPDLNTIALGHTFSSTSLVRTTTTDLGSDTPREVTPSHDFGCEYAANGTPADHFGLPVRDGRELRVHPGMNVPANGVVWTTTLQNSVFAGGATPPFTEGGETLRVQPIHRMHSDLLGQYPTYRLNEVGGTATAVGTMLVGTPRQLARGSTALELADGLGGDPAWTFGSVNPDDFAFAPESWLSHYGYVVSTSPFGQQFSTLGHNSWTWRWHGNDEESDGAKRYSTEQFTYWLDVTTVNAAAQHVFWVHCDIEDRDVDQMVIAYEDIALKIETACAALGIDDWTMLVLIPYLHENNLMVLDEVRQANHDARNAAHAVADVHPRVCVYSIHDATDGVFFDGSPAARQWLLARGLDSFTYGTTTVDLVNDLGGDLLDGSEVHPGGEAAAVYFASLAGHAILDLEPEPCAVDLDDDGDVDFNDLLLVLASWGTCDACPADFDDDGIVGFTDVVYLLSLWDDCMF